MSDEVKILTVTVFPLLLVLITRFGIWRADRQYRQRGGNPAVVPPRVRTGCTWLPGLVLFVILVLGMAREMGVAP